MAAKKAKTFETFYPASVDHVEAIINMKGQPITILKTGYTPNDPEIEKFLLDVVKNVKSCGIVVAKNKPIPTAPKDINKEIIGSRQEVEDLKAEKAKLEADLEALRTQAKPVKISD